MIEPKDAIIRMAAYAPPLEGRARKLRLDFNENTTGCSPAVQRAIAGCDPAMMAVYPEYERLRKKAAERLDINEGMILLTNGADEGIKLVMDTFVEPGDDVVIPIPTFAMFGFYASLARAVVTEVPYDTDLSFPTQAVLQALRQGTRLLVLVDPNNPTGTSIPEDGMKRILDKAQENDILVVIDEAYQEFSGRNRIPLLKGYDNIVILRTFSKGAGLAGLRLGMAIARPDIVGWMRKASSPYNVNAMTVQAGIAALEDTAWRESYAAEVRQNREVLTGTLQKLGLAVCPSEANFVLVDFGDRCEEICGELASRDILIRNRSADPSLEGFARVGVGSADVTAVFVNELRRIMGTPDPIDGPLVLFDMDGVLADVSGSYREAIRKTVSFFSGKVPAPQEIQAVKAGGGANDDWDLTRNILKKYGIDVAFPVIKDRFQRYYLGERYTQGIMDGLITRERLLLSRRRLRELSRERRLGVVTARPREEAMFFLKRNGIADLFDVVITRDETGQLMKPSPYGLQLALARLGMSDAVYIGDTPDDMSAALKAKVKPIGVIPPYIDDTVSLRRALEGAGAWGVMDSITKVQDVIGVTRSKCRSAESTQTTKPQTIDAIDEG